MTDLSYIHEYFQALSPAKIRTNDALKWRTLYAVKRPRFSEMFVRKPADSALEEKLAYFRSWKSDHVNNQLLVIVN